MTSEIAEDDELLDLKTVDGIVRLIKLNKELIVMSALVVLFGFVIGYYVGFHNAITYANQFILDNYPALATKSQEELWTNMTLGVFQ